ncbi:hypothetical protein RSP03_12190 [Cereibacter sphaeroides]|nr:hypothetical protein RSP03_12190 [Cereibacter sphaeroides]
MLASGGADEDAGDQQRKRRHEHIRQKEKPTLLRSGQPVNETEKEFLHLEFLPFCRPGCCFDRLSRPVSDLSSNQEISEIRMGRA